MVFSTSSPFDEGLDPRFSSLVEARPKSRASKSADNQLSSMTSSYSFPEPGPSEPCRLPRINWEFINRGIEDLRSGNHISWHGHSIPLPVMDDIPNIPTNEFYTVDDNTGTSDDGSKGKQKANDDIPPPLSTPQKGQCESCNPALTTLIANILNKSSNQTRLDEKEPPAPATTASDLDKVDPDTHAASDISNHHSQSSVTSHLEAAHSQLQLLLELLRTQHRQCYIWVRLQSPHRQAERRLKQLVKAVDRLIQALKMTIASCFIINRILGLIWQLGNVFGSGKEEDIVDRAKAVRTEVKDMRQELCERKSGS
ncbi:hypothetical protein DV737_g2864, partial [Chaetothyriales sp. CBS 132003]